ncbi:MAG: NADH-quinone oxidoreductase subunit L [Spirochaetota bacterium]
MFYLIPVFPLIGVLLNGLFGIKYFPKKLVHSIAVAGIGLSFIFSVISFFQIANSTEPYLIKTLFTWVPASIVNLSNNGATSFVIDFAFRFDSLTSVMTLVVTGVGLLIHIYSIGYMAHDASYARFFTYLNLFSFAMLILVLGANLAIMFIGWEGVGLCSYLLIGFWFNKDSAANAGKKAFITNRVGDFGFLIGIGFLIYYFGTIDVAQISTLVEGGNITKETATIIALCLFVGATGKSAQIPLYTWLPDAMEGPTPVSALIHAATMVTAGVYMVARMNVLFTYSGTALAVVALVGVITAVYAATMGFVQTDIKRVLAYSTISQIGYMFVGLGVGAYAAGVFHLMTHAFFKSLLFLSAGSVIHAMSGQQDMRKMGGLRKHIPKTFLVMFVATLAISGIPGFSGFFSKDEILASAYASGNYLVWALGVVGAGMTAFYMFRLIFMTFYGDERIDHEAKHHLHESPNVMIKPLQVLAILSFIGGYVGLPHIFGGHNWFGQFLSNTVGHHELGLSAQTEILLMAVSVGIGFFGILMAYIIYVKLKGRPAESLAEKFKIFYKLVLNKYFIDEIYNGLFVGGAMKLGTLLGKFDLGIIDGIVNGVASLVRKISTGSMAIDSHVVDGAVNGVGSINNFFSKILKRFQTGYVYNYALSIVIGVVIILTLTVIVYN